MKTKILVIRFQNTITKAEIPFFRGAVIKALEENNDILFHNHTEENFRYSYPLIQYKRVRQKATIVCINEGTSAIGKFFASCDFKVSIGKRQEILKIEDFHAGQYQIQIVDNHTSYFLRQWLPLNSDNYQLYLKLENLDEKIRFLEKMLVGNILSFAKGLGIFFEQEIIYKILTLKEPHLITYKQIKLMSFDLEFKTNVYLPDYIGLGKGVSMGYGMIVRKYENQ